MDALAEGTAPKDEIIARLNEEKPRKTVRATELTSSKLASIGSLLCSLAWVRDYRSALINAAVGKVGRGPQGELACSCLRFTRCRRGAAAADLSNEPAA